MYTHYRGQHPFPTEDRPATDEDRRRYTASDQAMRRIEAMLDVEVPEPDPDAELDDADTDRIRQSWLDLVTRSQSVVATAGQPTAEVHIDVEYPDDVPIEDLDVKGRCKNGHPFDPNSDRMAYTHPRNGTKVCRRCRKEAQIRSRARRAAREAESAPADQPEYHLSAA